MTILTNERGDMSGQSTGMLVGMVVGAVVGLVLAIPTGGLSIPMGLSLGASIGGTVGGLAGAMYDTATAPDNVMQQEQLSRIFIQDSGYGGAIPQVFQKYRLAGNVVWLGNKYRHEHRETASAGGKGFGGGPENVSITYTYTVSLAVMLCDTRLTGPMHGISKIWADGTVIYDRETHAALPEAWTFFPGDGVQPPSSTIEAVEGVGKTPAYRYRCYVVGTDVDLGALGRVPNYTFEVYQTEEAAASKLGVLVVPSQGEVWTCDPTGLLFARDTTTQEVTRRQFLSNERPLYGDVALAATAAGLIWVGNVDAYTLWTLPPAGGLVTTALTTTLCSNLAVLGTTAWFATRHATDGTGHLHRIDSSGALATFARPYSFWARLQVDPVAAVVWVTSPSTDGTTTLTCVDATGATLHTLVLPDTAGTGLALDASGGVWVADATHATLLHYTAAGALVGSYPTVAASNAVAVASDGMVWVGGRLQTARHDPTTGAIVRQYNFALGYFGVPNAWNESMMPSTDGAMFRLDPVSGRLGRLVPDGPTQVLRLPLSPIDIRADGAGGVWFCSREAAMIGQVTAAMQIRLDSTPAHLSNVLQVLAQAAGIPADAIDVSQVPQEPVLLGVLNVEAARVPLEMLCRAYQVIPVESGGVLRFLPRKQSVLAATIPQEDLLATEETGAGGALIVRTPDALMPTAVQVQYIDPQQSYQQNTQRATVIPVREQALHPNERTLNLLIGLSASQAKRQAQEALDRLWLERTSVQFATTRQYARLEPGDRVQVEVRGFPYPLLLQQVAYGRPGLLRYTGVVDSSTVLDEWVPMPGEPPAHTQPPVFLVVTVPRFLHLPALGPSDVASRYHVVYTATATGFRGATLWQAQDTVDYRQIDRGSLQGITGTATLLPAANPALLDDVSTVTVTLTHGTLLSISDPALLNGGNACTIGAELLQFGRATLVGPQTWELGRLLRGRRGTEGAVAGHADGEPFVLLDSAVRLLPLPLSERGVPQTYKAVSSGQALAEATPHAHTPQAANLLPWSVAYPSATHEPDDDWGLAWWPRARFNSLWTSDNEEIVADSDVVSYQLRIWDGATVVRTVTVPLAADVRDQVVWVYTAAMQTTDFGAAQSSVTWSVRQRGTYGWGEDTLQTVSA